ncbi:unnamed protein product [Dicrocoelium dendriticum]|nr:unnamed protein product [Dicrocoelium dendriticum]
MCTYALSPSDPSPSSYFCCGSKVSITFSFPDGRRRTVEANVGDTLLDVVIDNEDYKNLSNPLTVEEQDMLDLATGLTETELYNTFISPCNDSCIGRSQDLDYAVPPEYLIRHLISDRLPDPPVDHLSEETLFWLFYNCCREEVQLVVAKELYQREWRFHKKEQLWLTRVVGANFTTDNTSEQGDYYFWDPIKAQKSTHQMTIQYADLDDAPSSFRLSSGTLSAYVSIVPPVNAGGAHQSFNAHPHSGPPSTLQQHFAAYQHQHPHHQALLNRQQTGIGNVPPNAAPHSTINQIATPVLSGVSSAAALASLFNARHQSQAVSPTSGYFQPSTLLTRTGTVAPLFASRSATSVTVSASNSLASAAVAPRTMPFTTIASATTTPSSSGLISVGNNAGPSAHAMGDGLENESSVARTVNRIPTTADLVGVPSAFDNS